MPKRIVPELEHKVLAYLDLQWSPKQILKELKNQNIVIHRSMISKIRNRKENPINGQIKYQNSSRKSILTEHQFNRLKKLVEKPNPPTQKSMGKMFDVSQQVISYQINKVMNKKLIKKPKGQALIEEAILKRRRAWPLYR